jgi:hypothetical protein
MWRRDQKGLFENESGPATVCVIQTRWQERTITKGCFDTDSDWQQIRPHRSKAASWVKIERLVMVRSLECVLSLSERHWRCITSLGNRCREGRYRLQEHRENASNRAHASGKCYALLMSSHPEADSTLKAPKRKFSHDSLEIVFSPKSLTIRPSSTSKRSSHRAVPDFNVNDHSVVAHLLHPDPSSCQHRLHLCPGSPRSSPRIFS